MSNTFEIHHWSIVRACVNNVWYERLYINGEAIGLFPDKVSALAELDKIKNQKENIKP